MLNLIVIMIMVILSLFIFKSGWLLTFLDKVPFIDNVVTLVTGYGNVTAGVAPPATAKVFFDEFFKSFIYLSVFALVSKGMQAAMKVGKHEKISSFSLLLRAPVVGIASTFFSVVITTLLIESVNAYLNQVLSVSKYLVAGLSTLMLVLVILVAFIMLGKTLMQFLLQLVVGIVLPATVKLVAVEFIVVFLYVMLNVPGALDAAGTIVIMVTGILFCLGSIVGAEFLGSKFDD